MPPSQLSKVVERTDVSAILLSGTRSDLWQDEVESEFEKSISSMKIPVMFGGEISEAHKEKLESLGAHTLGADHVKAMERMESIIPAFTKK